MQYFNDLTPGRGADLRPGHGPARPAQEVARGAAAQEPQPGRARASPLPIVTSGVTHALSLVGDLFVDKGDMVLLPDKFWENYELLFGVRFQAQLALYPFFNASGGFNVEALRQALATRAGSWKTILILNFPNNPTGYSITKQRGRADRRRCCCEAADDGRNLIVVTDDAYFGLFYGEDVLPGVALRPAGRLPRADPGRQGRRPDQGGVRLGLPHRHADLQHAGLLQRRGALRRPGEEGRRRHPQRDLQLLARRPVGAGQGAWPTDALAGRAAAEEGASSQARAKKVHEILSVARVRRALGALSLQRRLLHVPEAQGARRRDATASTCWRSTAWA